MSIGKRIGKTLYIHKKYIDKLDSEHQKMLQLIEKKNKEFYNNLLDKSTIIKFDSKELSFIECINFDKSLNPQIRKWHKFSFENDDFKYLGFKTNSATNPLILHKKELMVCNDYDGFSVDLAKKWDNMLFTSNILEFSEKKKIGRLKYWKNAITLFAKENKIIYDNFIKEWEGSFNKKVQ